MITNAKRLAIAAGLLACLAPSLDAQSKKTKSKAKATSTGFKITQNPFVPTWQWGNRMPIWIDLEGSGIQIRVQSNGEVQIYKNGKLSRRYMPTALGKPVAIKDSRGKVRAKVRSAPRYVATQRASLGVQVTKLSAALASHLAMDVDDGVLVQSVTKGGAAQKAGIRRHDVIVGLGNSGGITSAKLSRILGKYKPGDRLVIRYLRAGKIHETTAKLGASKVYSWLNNGYLLNTPYYYDTGANFNPTFGRFKLKTLPGGTFGYDFGAITGSSKGKAKTTSKTKSKVKRKAKPTNLESSFQTGKFKAKVDLQSNKKKESNAVWWTQRPDLTPYILPRVSLDLSADAATIKYLDRATTELKKSSQQLQKNALLWTQVNKQLNTKAKPKSSAELSKIRALLKELEAKNRRIDRLLDRLEKIGKIR